MTQLQQRNDLRPHGVVSATCPSCIFFGVCGGIEPATPLLNCFDLSCCGNGHCDEVCPNRSDFPARMAEIGGLRFDNLPPIEQHADGLPHYVPMIHHGYSRRKLLSWPVVALDTYQVFRLIQGRYTAIATEPTTLRREFGLASACRVVLRGTAKDRALERYWSYRRRDHAAEQMAKLNPSLAIGPNYSHFLDVPRTDNLFNRKRQLICLAEMSAAGLSAVPHLSAVTPRDWKFWLAFLRTNPQIHFVAIEFQTGNHNRQEGERVLDRLARLRDSLNRPLHPILIGAAQFVEFAAIRFERFTLIDSEPFMKSVKRQRFDGNGRHRPWRESWTLEGQSIDEIVTENLLRYGAWIEERVLSARKRKEVTLPTTSVN